LRGEPKALSTQLVVVGQIGPPFAGASSGDVVRKQPREPEAVVAEMRAQQEGPFPGVVEPHEVLHHVDQIVVSLVVAAADAECHRAPGRARRAGSPAHAADHGRWPESCPNLPLALLPPERRPSCWRASRRSPRSWPGRSGRPPSSRRWHARSPSCSSPTGSRSYYLPPSPTASR